MLKKLLAAAFVALLAFPVSSALAQTGTVTGTVTDSLTGEPLPGVNVVIEGTQLGSATGAQGVYTIEGVPTGQQTLVASFVGYDRKTQTATVEAGPNEVDLQLASATVGLEDVVVTALGIEQEERSLGYSIEAVDGAELADVPDVNFVSSLQGRVAGANFFQSNSLGGSTRITLRGISSISGNNQPLFVVDGVPIDNRDIQSDLAYDYGNAASIVNPENVESVSILKGGAATALYGSRGANGVIQITTKSGRGTQGIGVTVNTSLTATDIYGLPNYQNEFGGGYNHPFFTLDGDYILDGPDDQYIVSYGEDESWGPRLDDGRMVREWFSWDDVDGMLGMATPWDSQPDNVENFFRTGLESNTTVSFSQGRDDFNYRLGLSNVSARGTYPNQELSRRTVSFNGEVNLTDALRVRATANYVDSDASGRAGLDYGSGLNPFLQFTHFGHRQVDLSENAPMRNIVRPDGVQRSWNWDVTSDPTGAQTGAIRYTDNPFWVQRENFQSDDQERVFGKAAVEYAFTDDLLLSTELGTDFYTDRRQERVAVGSNGLSDYDEAIYEVQEIQAQARLGYDTQLNEDFTFNTFGATEYRYESYSANAASTAGGLIAANVYTVENSVDRPEITDYFEEQGVYSLYGSAQVGWRSTLYATVTARNDWSSTLPEGENSYFYPSLSGSFVFSSLPALQGLDVLSFGKIRASYAQNGNDTDPYRLLRTYPVGTPFGTTPVQTLPNSLNNDELRPETTTSWEIGTQLDFFNNRLGLDATYFIRETTDQILPVDVSRATGYASALVNAGLVTNDGVELSLSATPVLAGDFQWNVNANWSKINNEIEDLTEGLEAFNITSEVRGAPAFGPRVQARVGQPYGVIYGSAFVYDQNGDVVLNANGVPVATPTPEIIGNYQPDWTAGISNTFAYKGVSASLTFDGQKGGDIFSLSNLWGMYSGMFSETTDGDIRALGLNPEGVTLSEEYNFNPDDDIPHPSELVGEDFDQTVRARGYFAGLFTMPREAVVYDASYIKLREARIAYTLPQSWFNNAPIRRMTVALVGSNLATLFKNAPNIDPSYAIGAGNLQGYEEGQDPPKRSYGFSFRLEL